MKNLPDQIRDDYDDIPWRRIAGLRDILIHEYSGVQEERIWKAIEQDLPGLRENILQIKQSLEE